MLLSRVSSIDHMRLRPCGIREETADASRNTMTTTTALDSGPLNDLTRYAASWSGTLCHASSTCATKKGSNRKGAELSFIVAFLELAPTAAADFLPQPNSPEASYSLHPDKEHNDVQEVLKPSSQSDTSAPRPSTWSNLGEHWIHTS